MVEPKDRVPIMLSEVDDDKSLKMVCLIESTKNEAIDKNMEMYLSDDDSMDDAHGAFGMSSFKNQLIQRAEVSKIMITAGSTTTCKS
eukprot:8284024-Ditylum_brightwellii.AAC.1